MAATTTRVQLKRVFALKAGDVIRPGLGLFTRTGQRMTNQAEMSASWGRGVYFVHEKSWMNTALELNVALIDPSRPDILDSILHTPMDAYVVLA